MAPGVSQLHRLQQVSRAFKKGGRSTAEGYWVRQVSVHVQGNCVCMGLVRLGDTSRELSRLFGLVHIHSRAAIDPFDNTPLCAVSQCGKHIILTYQHTKRIRQTVVIHNVKSLNPAHCKSILLGLKT